ncbi:aldehyde dehydrogenase (NADP(+)) [Kutzneria kofuensis]|uniref:NADP-dependent aldehyde dehydrogenase n=1 Tax=Kutzneria kofuensis TaxID=103725 RepID=A0A7W9NJD1_9PSEU|nr:aldehyde dehydrogenase (NADP(+)) [Kutzneria kofuensis]MBB5894519.1 NADP-dependent aldehyde dehydrogenase [Kutzneria kofuensis]
MSAIQGYNPRTGEPFGEPIESTSDAELDAIVAKAVASGWSATTSEQRAEALERVADALDAESELLVSTADSETALGRPRLSGELKRTTNQLRLFASVLREGSYLEATIDTADATTVPPRPELRRILRSIGPVAVFAASNFPFAFSVAGGDTASALAAGSPVIVKAHPSHPRTSHETARIVAATLPEGVFGIVHGLAAGPRLVQHPAVKAVGFTGSTGGGRALFDLATSRPEPIPFYGELGSVNPTVILPGAATEETAAGFAGSLTLGVGQFCTNPGLLFAPASMVEALTAAVDASSGGPMLNERMQQGYRSGVDSLAGSDLVELAATGTDPAQGYSVAPKLFTTELKTFAANLGTLTEEHFGPAAVVVTYTDPEELLAVLPQLPGSLTATVHASAQEHELTGRVGAALQAVAGRLIFNAWPTGVAVAWGMQHGGPWPATTNSLFTSVGATAIRRWLVPVTYQSWPEELLPPELQAGNPLGIPRRFDGVLGTR